MLHSQTHPSTPVDASSLDFSSRNTHHRIPAPLKAVERVLVERSGLSGAAWYANMIQREAAQAGIQPVGFGGEWVVVGGSPVEELRQVVEVEELRQVVEVEELRQVVEVEELRQVVEVEELRQVEEVVYPSPGQLERIYRQNKDSAPCGYSGLLGLIARLASLLPSITGYLYLCSLGSLSSDPVALLEYHLDVVQSLSPRDRATYHHSLLFKE